jgi:hypothetical protein
MLSQIERLDNIMENPETLPQTFIVANSIKNRVNKAIRGFEEASLAHNHNHYVNSRKTAIKPGDPLICFAAIDASEIAQMAFNLGYDTNNDLESFLLDHNQRLDNVM